MSRALIIIRNDEDRLRAAAWCRKAPPGCRIEWKEAKRSLEQNNAMWAALTDIASQATHNGRKYPADIWRVLFLNGWQKELSLIPTLDGTGLLPLTRTSDLSRAEMSDLLAFIDSWASEKGIKLNHPEQAA